MVGCCTSYLEIAQPTMFFTTTPHLPRTLSLQGRTESSLGDTKIWLSSCKSCFILMIITVEKKQLKAKGQSNYMYFF